MGYRGENVNKPRRYIQYNDLVFTGTRSIQEQAESVAFRVNSTPRAFTHGAFVGNRGEELLVDTHTISFKMALKTNTWSDENIRVHYDFIVHQLTRKGKLWAVDSGNQLIWCHAYCTSMQQQKEWTLTDNGYLVIHVEFNNAEGVWHKASEHKTYFDRFDLCSFTQMKADCLKSRCCDDSQPCSECECCNDNCSAMKDMIDYCSAVQDIDFNDEFFDLCDSKWRVVHNCQKARIDGKTLPELYAHALCDLCVNGELHKTFQADTVLDSTQWRVGLFGHFKDPIITVNNTNIKVKGEYNGVLTLDQRGNVRYASSWECLEYDYKVVKLDNLSYCEGPFRIIKGRNTINVYGVLSSTACAYVDYERLTL